MKSKIILNLAISLDGFIADEHDGYDWIVPSGDKSLNSAAAWSHDAFLEQISAVVMGKRCYDLQMHAEYANKQVYVITSQALSDYGNIHFISGDICAALEALKQQAKGDIYLFGGSTSIDPVLKAGMIDEYVIGIIPVILGQGIPLFLADNPMIPLQLTHQYVEDGIVVLRYVPRKA